MNINRLRLAKFPLQIFVGPSVNAMNQIVLVRNIVFRGNTPLLPLTRFRVLNPSEKLQFNRLITKITPIPSGMQFTDHPSERLAEIAAKTVIIALIMFTPRNTQKEEKIAPYDPIQFLDNIGPYDPIQECIILEQIDNAQTDKIPSSNTTQLQTEETPRPFDSKTRNRSVAPIAQRKKRQFATLRQQPYKFSPYKRGNTPHLQNKKTPDSKQNNTI